jgi:hypothetical protein
MPTGNADYVTPGQLGQVKGDVTKLSSKIQGFVTQDELAAALSSDGFRAVVDDRVARAVDEIGVNEVAKALRDMRDLQEKVRADIGKAGTQKSGPSFVGRSINWTADKLAPESARWNLTIRTIGWVTFLGLCAEGAGYLSGQAWVRPSTYLGKVF